MSPKMFTLDETTDFEKLMIAGGNEHSSSTTDIDVYDGTTLRLDPKISMPADLFDFAALQIHVDKLMVVGGMHAGGQPRNYKTYIYTISTNCEFYVYSAKDIRWLCNCAITSHTILWKTNVF